MKPRYDDGFAQMFVGDATDVLSRLPEKSIHCCVTSPPYFGLRSYLAADHPDKAREGGTQETPEQYVQWLVDVFRGVWRVLRDDGTAWLNLGDSYASSGVAGHQRLEQLGIRLGTGGGKKHTSHPAGRAPTPPGLKPKDLLMIPARVALALQADGWFVRSQIVWTKPNPMPESVTDRPTQATEMVYLLTKKPRYFYDSDAVREPSQDGGGGYQSRRAKGIAAPKRPEIAVGPQAGGGHSQWESGEWGFGVNPAGRNLRNYWQISTRPYPGSHYATFPPELPLRCIKAGTSEHGVCSERSCGAPWRRVVEHGEVLSTGGSKNGKRASNMEATSVLNQKVDNAFNTGEFVQRAKRTIGFEPTCSHNASEATIPATVLDPFSGSGTTGLVASKLGRRSVLIDIDDRNVKLLEQRMGYQGVLL